MSHSVSSPNLRIPKLRNKVIDLRKFDNSSFSRRCAQAHGIQMTGTLGLVLLAKKRGLISEAGSALDAIVAAGLYVSEKMLADVRARAGE